VFAVSLINRTWAPATTIAAADLSQILVGSQTRLFRRCSMVRWNNQALKPMSATRLRYHASCRSKKTGSNPSSAIEGQGCGGNAGRPGFWVSWVVYLVATNSHVVVAAKNHHLYFDSKVKRVYRHAQPIMDPNLDFVARSHLACKSANNSNSAAWHAQCTLVVQEGGNFVPKRAAASTFTHCYRAKQ